MQESNESAKPENAKPDLETSVTEHGDMALSSKNQQNQIKKCRKKRKRNNLQSEVSSPKQSKLETDTEDGQVSIEADVENNGLDHKAEELLWETNHKVSGSEFEEYFRMSKKKLKKRLAAARPSREKLMRIEEKKRKILKRKQKAAMKREKANKPVPKAVEKEEVKETRQVFNFDSPEGFLACLIAPVSIEKFFSEHWEKKPLFIQRRDKVYAETYKTLFSRKILEDILIRRNIEFVKDINVCKFDGEKRESLNKDGRATLKKIKRLLDQDRGTVQFHQPQRFQVII